MRMKTTIADDDRIYNIDIAKANVKVRLEHTMNQSQ